MNGPQEIEVMIKETKRINDYMAQSACVIVGDIR